jgi:hypothetical protein
MASTSTIGTTAGTVSTTGRALGAGAVWSRWALTRAGKRIRRKVSGKSRTEVKDKLKDLHSELDAGVRPVAGYTVDMAVADWLIEGLPGRAVKTIEVYRMRWVRCSRSLAGSRCGT